MVNLGLPTYFKVHVNRRYWNEFWVLFPGWIRQNINWKVSPVMVSLQQLQAGAFFFFLVNMTLILPFFPWLDYFFPISLGFQGLFVFFNESSLRVWITQKSECCVWIDWIPKPHQTFKLPWASNWGWMSAQGSADCPVPFRATCVMPIDKPGHN